MGDSILNAIKGLSDSKKAEAFITLANFYGSKREFEKLIEAADSAIYYAKENKDLQDEADAYALKGRVY